MCLDDGYLKEPGENWNVNMAILSFIERLNRAAFGTSSEKR